MSLTPPGGRLLYSNPATINECWINEAYSPRLTDLDTAYPTFFDNFVIRACARINKMCNRKFNLQQADDVFLDRSVLSYDYVTFQIKNRPVQSIDKVYIQVLDSFTEVEQNYLQLDSESGVLKVLAQVYTTAAIPYGFYANSRSINTWVRHTSGYEITSPTVNEVPDDVREATALMVSYLFEVDQMDGTAKSYKTQTYSQTNVAGDESPKVMEIKEILQPYMLYTAVGSGLD